MMTLQYLPLEKVVVRRPVDRIAWIVEQAREKNILDLGAYDETARVKVATDFWLHGRLAKVARQVIGIDQSDRLPREGLQIAEHSIILKGSIDSFDRLTRDYDIDLIIAGELLEHLPSALDFLIAIKRNLRFSNKQLILSTPNATSLHNVLLAFIGCESTHPDHLQVYSYKTLNTLCSRAGFQSWEILPYHVLFTETILKAKGFQKLLAVVSEKMVNAAETVFPLLSGGWIVNIRI